MARKTPASPKAAGRRIQVRRSGVHGKGVFALADIARGERIIEYVGEVISWDEAVVNEIGSRCKEVESGARNVASILTRTVLPDLSGEFLARMAEGASISKVHVRVGEGGAFAYDIS